MHGFLTVQLHIEARRGSVTTFLMDIASNGPRWSRRMSVFRKKVRAHLRRRRQNDRDTNPSSFAFSRLIESRVGTHYSILPLPKGSLMNSPQKCDSSASRYRLSNFSFYSFLQNHRRERQTSSRLTIFLLRPSPKASRRQILDM